MKHGENVTRAAKMDDAIAINLLTKEGVAIYLHVHHEPWTT
jgi:hypothetical protein